MDKEYYKNLIGKIVEIFVLDFEVFLLGEITTVKGTDEDFYISLKYENGCINIKEKYIIAISVEEE